MKMLRGYGPRSVHKQCRKQVMCNEKWIFRGTKMKTSFGKLVGHSNIHTYAKYEIIWGNYHLKLAITSAICLESHEPSYSIAHFEKTFLIVLHYSKFFGLYGY